MTLLNLRLRKINCVISTDDIIPGKYKHMYTEPSDMAKHVFENLFPGLASTIKQGDALYSENIFGIGSSREQAVSALLASGIEVIFAPTFGRIFFRNCWNLGLLPISIEKPLNLRDEEQITLELEKGVIKSSNQEYKFIVPSSEMLKIYNHKGLLNMICKENMYAR